MDFKNFVIKVEYRCDGREYCAYGNDDVLAFDILSDSGRLSVKASSCKPVEILTAELIFGYEYTREDLFFANGYQSWTTSREYRKGEVQRGLRNVANFRPVKTFAEGTGDYGFAAYGKLLYHSVSYTYLRRGSNVEFVGSLDERTGYTFFYADMRENLFVVSKDLEGLTLDGECNMFDLVRFEGSYDEVFDKYFEALPQKHTGRIKHLAGYTSWYNYFQNINEEIILRDLNGIAKAGDSVNIFQIDDGYETAVGDWETDQKKFPRGMKFIADSIHEKGLTAGLWIAPFAAQFAAQIVKTHPEWLLRTPSGKKVVGGVAWGGFYVLDFELSEVRDYIRKFFDKVFDEWGFDMVKLDFLYAACILPRNGKTRGQLMCEAMDFLRECCRDKLMLGCGVPLAPSFGIVDACRISCDVELSFKDKFYVKCTNQEVVSARLAMNNSIYRRHLNGRIFANDPDVFFLRDDGMKKAKFTVGQKKLLAKINNMCGSVLFVSDDVNAYDDEKMNILLDSYRPFEGKIISAEQDGDVMGIVYKEKSGVTKNLFYNVYTGASVDENARAK